MKNTSALGLLGLIVAACDPNMPPAFINVPPPEWTQTIRINNVGKRSCSLTNAANRHFIVASWGTDIGNGLTATRSSHNCHVQDQNNVKCSWSTAKQPKWCYAPNPAYARYRATQK